MINLQVSIVEEVRWECKKDTTVSLTSLGSCVVAANEMLCISTSCGVNPCKLDKLHILRANMQPLEPESPKIGNH